MTNHQVLIGKDEWLFLKNDTNQLIRQITGEVTVSDSLINHWSNTLKLRLSFLEREKFHTHIFVPLIKSVFMINIFLIILSYRKKDLLESSALFLKIY